jgi:hypothetical protein
MPFRIVQGMDAGREKAAVSLTVSMPPIYLARKRA